MDDRYKEYDEDIKNLPERLSGKGLKEALESTRRGHRVLINYASQRLKFWENRYFNECGDDDDNNGSSCPSCPEGAALVGGACLAVAACILFPEVCVPAVLIGGAASQ